MNTSFRPARFSVIALAALALQFAPVPAVPDSTEISPVPLGTASSVTVLPNLMFILDDSGSMGRSVMPDNVDESNTCKTYVRSSGGSTTTNCLTGDTDLHEVRAAAF